MLCTLCVRAHADEITVGPGPDPTELPTVRDVQVEGLGPSQRLKAEILARPLLDQPADPDRIDGVLRALSTQGGLGAFDVQVERAGDVAVVILISAGPRRLVEGILLDTRPDDGMDPNPRLNSLLRRQLQASDHPLRTTEGQPFHPYWLEADVEAVRRFYVEDGHLDARVEPMLRPAGELVEVVFHITPGPVYSTGEITRSAPTTPAWRAMESVSLRIERGAPVPWWLKADAHRMRRAVCLAGGHPEATVDTTVSETGEERSVRFEVTPGPARKIRSIDFTHQSLPPSFLAEHGVAAGAPYCPDALVELEKAISARLKNEGFPDPDLKLSARSLPPAEAMAMGNRMVDVVIQVQPRTQAVIQRVWFDGNKVTEASVLESMVVVRDGDIFNQTDIDRSVQNLLRSGLFRRAYARVIDGGGGRFYLYFVVQEREFLSLSFQNQEVTFYNMDLTRAPTALGELTDGVTLRGRGQQLAIRAQKDHQRLRFRDPFLFNNMVTRVDLERREFGFSELDETVWAATLGLGLRAFENRLELIPVVAVETLQSESPARYASLPVRGDDQLRVLWGLETLIDLRLVDGERFPYLGALLETSVRNIGLPGYGKPDVLRLRTSGRFFLPLGTNRTGQHFVLESFVEGHWRISEKENRITAFERAAPEIRGYDREAHYLAHEIVSTDAEGRLQQEQVMLGSTEAYVGSVSIRLPLFNQRRTTLVPFLDAITMGDPRNPTFDRVFFGAGAQLRFSLFKERLEGFIYVAHPLNDTDEADFFGSGAGGSF